MIEWTLIVLCYAAVAAFRAAEPERFAAETGIAPDWLDERAEAWRRGYRVLGTVLLGLAAGLGWWVAGPFEGLVGASAAAMSGTLVIVLGAPVVRRLVWGLAAFALAATPVLVALVVWGGSHGG